VQDRFGGKVPCAMEELLELPGVARKTANIVLGLACGKVEGIPVDTHVRRFALRFALTKHTDPVKIEKDLMELLPREEWLSITFRLIEYGRSICPARPHECSEHPLTHLYPKAAEIWPKAKG
ncbi:MAG: endonuclease III, partial [Candidatus Pacearchaeota archaeon]|nr:endonuclease III [Candidatus Pacearchaeota archaeon]